jgi:hypothetical protein
VMIQFSFVCVCVCKGNKLYFMARHMDAQDLSLEDSYNEVKTKQPPPSLPCFHTQKNKRVLYVVFLNTKE